MDILLNFIKIYVWWMLFSMAAGAGSSKDLLLLGCSIIMATYWYWRYPVFKDDKNL